MSDQWYWRTNDSTFGPADTDDFVARVKAGEIAAHHELRLGTSGNWSPAAELIAAVQDGERPNASVSAADALVRAKHTRARGVTGHTQRPGLLSRCLAGVRSSADGLAKLVAGGIGFVLRKLWTKPGKLLVCGMLISALVLIILPLTPYGEPSMDLVAAEVNLAHLMISDFRERNADDQEWDDLQTLVLTELNPLIEEMEQLHKTRPTNVAQWSSGNRARSVIRREIISAGRHCIPRILIDVRNDQDPVVAQLEDHVVNIGNHISGAEPYPLTIAEARRRKHAIVQAERTWKARRNFIRNIDPATAAIVGVDVLIVLAVAVSLVRKRRKKAS